MSIRWICLKVSYFGVIATLAFPGSAIAQDAEEYKVYDAVVRHMFRDNTTQFDMNATVEQIVIRDRTFSQFARGNDKEDWQHARQFMRSLSDETVAGYELARKTEIEIKPKLAISLKYVLVSDTELRKIFNSPNEHTRTMEQWEDFYKVYTKSAGFNSFSRVGFDKAKQTALVYFVNWCGPLCGTGTYVCLEKRDDGWMVRESAGMWTS